MDKPPPEPFRWNPYASLAHNQQAMQDAAARHEPITSDQADAAAAAGVSSSFIAQLTAINSKAGGNERA
jgi:hypothetical protein